MKNLTPFKWFCLENFPFIEGDFDAINEYHLLCKIVKKINDIIKSENELGTEFEKISNSFIEIKNYVDNYFNNLDVQDEINNKLNEMVLDGSLADIIDQELLEKLQNAVQKDEPQFGLLNATRIFRKLFENGQNNTQYGNVPYYSHANGFAYIGDGNVVFAPTPYNIYNNKAKLQVVNIATGNVIREATLDLGHANAITYNSDNQKLYIGGCADYDEETQGFLPTKKIVEIDYLTLNITNTVEIENEVSSVAYDKVTHKLYAFSSPHLYELDAEYNIVRSIDIVYPFSYLTGQSIEVNNNILYRIVAQPNVIACYDIIQNKFINAYNLPDYLDEAYRTGEAEDLTYYNGDLYFLSNNLGCQNGDLRWVNIAKTSVEHNTIISNFNYEYARVNWAINIYIDNTRNIPNPDGTAEKPFKELVEAIDFIGSPSSVHNKYTLNIKASSTAYHYCYITSENILTIGRFSGDSARPIINGLRINTPAKILLRSLEIQSYNTVNTSPIELTNGDLNLDNMKYNDVQNSKCCVYASNSEVTLIGAQEKGVSNSALVYCSAGVILHTNSFRDDIVSNSSSNHIDKKLLASNLNWKVIGSKTYVPSYDQLYNKNFSDILSTFTFVNVAYYINAGVKVARFRIGDIGSGYSINDLDLYDSTAGDGGTAIEMKFNIKNTEIELTARKIVEIITGALSSRDYHYIKDIWLSND